MTAMKATCGYWKIWRIFSLSICFLLISCLDITGNITLQDQRFDIELSYSFSPELDEVLFNPTGETLIPLPLTQEQWTLWEEEIPEVSTGNFSRQENWDRVSCTLILENVDADLLNSLFPLEVDLQQNSFSMIFALYDFTSPWSESLEKRQLALNIKAPEALVGYNTGNYDENTNILSLQIGLADLIDPERDEEILLEW